MNKNEATNLKAVITELFWQVKSEVLDMEHGNLEEQKNKAIEVANRNRDDLLELIDSMTVDENGSKEIKTFEFMNK